MFKYVTLNGNEIQVDDQDAWIFDAYLVATQASVFSYTRYASLRDKQTRKYVTLLHRFILKPPHGKIVDHTDGNGLNCQRCNIRISDFSQNQFNRRLQVNQTKGVFFRKDRQIWVAKIRVYNRQIHIGHFDKYDDAVRARLAAEKKYHGAFAGLGTQMVK